MPLKKPSHPAAIFSNFIYKKGDDYVFKIGDGETVYSQQKLSKNGGAINIPLMLTDAVYEFGQKIEDGNVNPDHYKLMKIADLEGEKVSNVSETRKLFPTKFTGAAGLYSVQGPKTPYYDKNYGPLIRVGSESKINLVSHAETFIEFAFDYIIGFNNPPPSKFFTLPELELRRTTTNSLSSNSFSKKGFYDYTLRLDAATVALADHFFNREKDEYAFLANDILKSKVNFKDNVEQAMVEKAKDVGKFGGPGQPEEETYPWDFIPAAITLNGVDGIFDDSRLNFIETFLKPNGKILFDYLNFALKPNNQNVKLSAVTTPSFANKFMELKEEPKVPSGAKENNIISFYHDVLQGHSNAFDEKTFIYKNPKFSDFEVDVLAASTLVKKSNSHQDFVKPYASVEFFADFKTDDGYKKINFLNTQPTAPQQQEKYNNFKRFVSDKRELPTNLKGIIINNGTSLVDVYGVAENMAAPATKFLDNGSYDGNFTAAEHAGKIINTNRINKIGDIISPQGKSAFCPYEVVGYSITKSTKKKGQSGYKDSIIKRVYILNDKPDHVGYLRYFDSQIKEGIVYYYSIEQINRVYATQLRYTAKPGYVKTHGSNQKNFLHWQSDQNYSSVPQTLSVLAPNNTAAISANNKDFPFYNTKDMIVNMQVGISWKNYVIYTPVGESGEFGSPDIDFNEDVLKTKISAPDIKIYTRKGEINRAHIILSALGGRTEKILTLKDKATKVVNLGTSSSVIKNPVREYWVYRTTDRPESYESFSKTPHQILKPAHPDFTDEILPNIDYYYYATALGTGNTVSKATKVLKLIIINEQSLVYALAEVFNFGE